MASVKLTASGIDFSDYQTVAPTTGASAGSELLDHYEEGTWAPSGTNVSYWGAWYTKIGNQVTCHARLGGQYPSGGVSTATPGGLPFASSATSYHDGGGYVTWTNNHSTSHAQVPANGTGFTLRNGTVSVGITEAYVLYLVMNYVTD